MKRALPQSLATLLLAAFLISPATAAKPDADKPKDKDAKDVLSSGTFGGLKLREIGPATTSGRIADIAVDPTDNAVRYVAVASGGVWKTTNAGTTWKPIFDGQQSYSIGCVVLDPKNPLVVWVGTGENNSQRSVSYGDGVYKSTDGGATWKHVGLENSEHIGKILIDPREQRPRLRRRAGSVVEGRRRPRPLQHPRRRHHVEARSPRQRARPASPTW